MGNMYKTINANAITEMPNLTQKILSVFASEKLVITENNNNTSVSAVSYTHLRAHETVLDLVCRLLLEKKKHIKIYQLP